MGWSLSLGRLFGSELRVHVTFLVLLGWISLAAWLSEGPAAALQNTIFVLALFACVIAHEYGHALMARRYGISTPDITLLPIGGLARLSRMPEKPDQEIAVALAGPAVNLVIWAVLVVVFGTRTGFDQMISGAPAQADLLDQLAMVNLYLLAFNLLPAFPMDGGRVLRAVLSRSMGRRRGTQWAATIGRVMAVLFGLAGLSVGNPFLVLIAAFVFFAATAESNDVAMTDMATTRTASDAMITRYISLLPTDALARATDAIIRTTQHEFPVVDERGRAQGFLSRQAVFAAISQGEQGDVGDLMSVDTPRVYPTAPLRDVLRELGASVDGAVLVCAQDGALLGYVTRENIAELMIVADA